ncbi:MAG: elongation factor G, partial [Patescibacteria group bacterium]
DIIGDLSAKRAQIQGTEKKGNLTYIYATAPLSELTGYVTKIRSISQGRASLYMEPSHYEQVPTNITEKLIAKKTGGDGGNEA